MSEVQTIVAGDVVQSLYSPTELLVLEVVEQTLTCMRYEPEYAEEFGEIVSLPIGDAGWRIKAPLARISILLRVWLTANQNCRHVLPSKSYFNLIKFSLRALLPSNYESVDTYSDLSFDGRAELIKKLKVSANRLKYPTTDMIAKTEKNAADAVRVANDLKRRYDSVSAADVNFIKPAFPAINIVFEDSTYETPGRFVEVENDAGESISVGEWIKVRDDLWKLRITTLEPSANVSKPEV